MSEAAVKTKTLEEIVVNEIFVYEGRRYQLLHKERYEDENRSVRIRATVRKDDDTTNGDWWDLPSSSYTIEK